MKICSCVINKVNKLKLTTEIIKNYLTDPVGTLEADIARIQLGNNVLEEEITRNILLGISSENTKNYALGIGRRHLVDSLTAQVKDISAYLNKKIDTFKLNAKRLENAMKSFDSIFLDGTIETRVTDIQTSDLYKNYFKTRLENEFLPTLNGSTYQLSVALDMNKVILIIRHFLAKTTNTNEVAGFVNNFTEFDKLLEAFKDVQRIEAQIPSEELDLVEGVDEQPFDVSILNKNKTGKVIMEIAKETPELDTTQVDVIESCIILLDKFTNCYDKLSADVQTILNVLNIKYSDTISATLKLIEERVTKTADDYVDMRMMDTEFDRVITNCINSIIRLLALDTFISEATTQTTNALATTVSEYVGFYHLYRDMMMYSLKLGKTRKVENAKM